ncbi:MAG TPA: DNA adenine methylase [Pyrinomonadaceae bacterium]|jgi:DNA adenine methylase|nr:DNA adenine methylase [Pyrinomonadaceae bacterium]
MNKTITASRRTTDKQQPSIKRNDLAQPFLKWAGGKRQLLPKIREYIPRKYKLYFEPFVGAGAVLFDLQPQTVLINDANEELVNCYKVIKNHPTKLIAAARAHPINKKHFYHLRSQDRDPGLTTLTTVERAARIIYLNKTCFNGLFRVNSQGQFNVPFGKYTDPTIVNDVVIKAVSQYLNKASVQISNDDFEDALQGAGRGDFVYLDPPYDPLSDTSSFTGYDLTAFGREEQRRLKDVCDRLHHTGCKVLLSNSATPFIRKLYSDRSKYTVVEIDANRNINALGTGRGKITELLIFNNYELGKI